MVLRLGTLHQDTRGSASPAENLMAGMLKEEIDSPDLNKTLSTTQEYDIRIGAIPYSGHP